MNSLATVARIETPGNAMRPKEIQQALDLVRGYQVMQFVDRLKAVDPEKAASMHEADEAVQRHGAIPITYVTRLDSLVLIAGILSRVELPANCPDLDQVRLNFIVGVASVVKGLNPALASVALGETRVRYQVPVLPEKKAKKNDQRKD